MCVRTRAQRRATSDRIWSMASSSAGAHSVRGCMKSMTFCQRENDNSKKENITHMSGEEPLNAHVRHIAQTAEHIESGDKNVTRWFTNLLKWKQKFIRIFYLRAISGNVPHMQICTIDRVIYPYSWKGERVAPSRAQLHVTHRIQSLLRLRTLSDQARCRFSGQQSLIYLSLYTPHTHTHTDFHTYQQNGISYN